jgi:integrase
MQLNKASARGAIKFTDRELSALSPPPPGKKDYLKFDSKEHGLAIRVGRSGSKKFFFQKLVNGRRARIPLGHWPATSILGARKDAHALAQRLNEGEDVGAAHRTNRARGSAIARGEFKTLRSAIGGFIEENPNGAGEGHLERKRSIMGRVFKRILERPFDELTTEDFKLCLRVVKGRGARDVAVRHAAAVTRWGAVEYKMADPLAGQKKKLSKAPPARQEFLSNEHPRTVFRVAGTLGGPAGPLIQFMMLTGVRANEAACARWSEFDEHFAKWEIPAGRMKGGERARMHWVPLAPQVGELLRRLEHQGSDFVFTHTGKKPARGFGRFKQRLVEALKKADAGVPGFRFHDFRRTFIMWGMAHGEDFKFPVDVVANRCLGHDTFDPVKKAYNPYAFQKERRILLTEWANFLTDTEASRSAEPIDVEYREVQPPQLPAPPKWAVERDPAGTWKKAYEFARHAFYGLLFTVTDPKAPAAIQSMLRRGPDAYVKKFREGGPPMSEIGRFAVQYALEQTIIVAYRVFTDPSLSKIERAKAVQKAVKENLAEIYVKSADENATTLANAAIDAALTRWPLRQRKPSSNPEPISSPGAATQTAA